MISARGGKGRGGRSHREVTSQFLLSSDWSGASPSWSVLACPHLLSPPSSLCPPLSRPILLPASRLWATSGVSTSLLAHLQPVSTFLCSRLQAGQARLRARGKEAYSGHLLLQLTGGAQCLLQLDISRKTLVAVSPPPGEQLDQVSVVPGHLWVLTESGSVYLQARTRQWPRLSTNQQGGAGWSASVSARPTRSGQWTRLGRFI